MASENHFVICVANDGEEDLQIRKVYRVLPDEAGATHGMLRVIDDSGEDYLYPQDFFLAISLPPTEEAKLQELLAAGSLAS